MQCCTAEALIRCVGIPGLVLRSLARNVPVAGGHWHIAGVPTNAKTVHAYAILGQHWRNQVKYMEKENNDVYGEITHSKDKEGWDRSDREDPMGYGTFPSW